MALYFTSVWSVVKRPTLGARGSNRCRLDRCLTNRFRGLEEVQKSASMQRTDRCLRRGGESLQCPRPTVDFLVNLTFDARLFFTCLFLANLTCLPNSSMHAFFTCLFFFPCTCRRRVAKIVESDYESDIYLPYRSKNHKTNQLLLEEEHLK